MKTYRKEIRNGRLIVWTETKGWELGEETIERYDIPDYFESLEPVTFNLVQFIRNLEREKHLERLSK